MSEKCKHLYAANDCHRCTFIVKTKVGYSIKDFVSKNLHGMKDDCGEMWGFRFKHCPKCGKKLDDKRNIQKVPANS